MVTYYASLAPLLKHKNFETLSKTRIAGCVGALDKAVPLNVRCVRAREGGREGEVVIYRAFFFFR